MRVGRGTGSRGEGMIEGGGEGMVGLGGIRR